MRPVSTSREVGAGLLAIYGEFLPPGVVTSEGGVYIAWMATASRKLMDEIVTARVDKDLKARLIKLARKNKRSPGTEARVAIRNHVDAAK